MAVTSSDADQRFFHPEEVPFVYRVEEKSSTSSTNGFGIFNKSKSSSYLVIPENIALDKSFYGFIEQNQLIKQLNFQKLHSFSFLEENWNFYGAKPFQKELINRVKSIINLLEIQPQVFPTGRDSIQLEFERGGDYLEFEIFSDGVISIFEIKGGREREEEIDESQMNEIVTSFYAE